MLFSEFLIEQTIGDVAADILETSQTQKRTERIQIKSYCWSIRKFSFNQISIDQIILPIM